ncbi:MAG: tetratricopeptide repeat protein [Syntrophobacteraceae bacterium]
MAIRGFRRGCLLFGLFALLLFSYPVQAQSTGSSASYQFALQAFHAGNMQEALSQIQDAILADPRNLEYQYLLGGIYFRLGKLDEAEGIFQVLVRMDESAYRKAWFDLANVYARRGKEASVIEALEMARPVDPGRADFEIGQAQMRLKDYQKAISYFRQARSKRPDLEAPALIHEAISLFHLKRTDESRKLLKELNRKELPAETKAEIKRLLDSIEQQARAAKPWRINGAVGLQYDSNIFQNPLQLSSGISGAEDYGFLANVSGRYDLYKQGPWTFGAAYNHYQITYFQNPDLGVLGARPGFYLLMDNPPFYPGLEYSYAHYWAGSDNKADVQTLLPSLVIAKGDHWRTDIRTAIDWRSFYDTTPDDRLFTAALTELYLFKGGRAHVRAGYLLTADEVVEREQGSYVGNGGMVGVQYPIWKDWSLDLSGIFLWRNYEFDPLLSATSNRKDNEQDLVVWVRGPIAPGMQLNFLFQHVWNDSNIVTASRDGALDPFNYRRAIFSCFVTFEY